MMSNKWAFSLTSLITIIALAFVVSPAMAATGGPTVTIETADHHFDDGKQVAPGTITVANTSNDTLTSGGENSVKLTIKFGDPVNFNDAASDDAAAPAPDFAPAQEVQILYFNDKDVEQTAPSVAWGQVKSTEYVARFAPGATIKKVRVYVPEDAATAISGSTAGKGSQAATYSFDIIAADKGSPMPITVIRLIPESSFVSTKVTGPFDVKIVLSEKPKEFKAGNIGVENGSVGTVVDGGTVDALKYFEGDVDGVLGTYNIATAPANTTALNAADFGPSPTGNNDNFYQYKVTITPTPNKDKVIVWVKDFEDRELAANKYEVGRTSAGASREVPKNLAGKKEKVEVSVDLTGKKIAADPGMSVGIPNDTIIPAGGYLVVVRDDEDGANEAQKSSESQVIHPGDRTEAIAGSGRSVIKQAYNVVPVDLKYDLEGFLIRGGTIDLIAPDAGVMISEIMWATDGGDTNRQWIEIHNTGSTDLTTKDYKLMLYTANEAPGAMSVAANNIQDRVSTLYKGTNHWSIAGKGKSGQTAGIIERSIGDGPDVDIDIEVVQTSGLISMERVIDAAGMYVDGTMDTSWAQSMPPSSNFMDAAGGLFVGSPGASPINRVADPVPPPTPTPTPPTDVATAADIMITEIMVDTGNGRLPQWIELTNVSGAEKSLAGWSVEISNAAADADVVGATVSIDLKGTLGVGGGTDAGGTRGKALLLVAWGGRSSTNLDGSDRVVNVSGQLKQKGRYTLLSPMGFMIELLPPQTTGIVQFGDSAGNLGAAAAWDLPMSDNGRSSLIRVFDTGVAEMGTDVSGWALASSTSLLQAPATWYGSDEDAGTPGVVGGGPLPVELSHFRPARDKATGAVVITWATQSELNNAGFFIKRSNQKNGEFKVINATMIAGAGTTSEKQFYTYTDTTAQPNIVYYYQIEDVSLDGNRQTLTNGIRLKGHIGAAGKLTSTWGELKSSNE